MQYLAIALVIGIFVIIALIKQCSKLNKEAKEAKIELEKAQKYKETIDEKIGALHTGDPLANALDILSKYKK